VCTTMDLLPTFARLAGAPRPAHAIDGHDVLALLCGEPTAKSPWDDAGFAYYRMEQLQAIRAGPWKLYLPLEKKIVTNARRTAPAKAELFDVRHDVHEDHEVSARHPEIVRRLQALAERIRTDIGDEDRPGKGQRPAGHVENPQPLRP
jgi:arylsulfatase A